MLRHTVLCLPVGRVSARRRHQRRARCVVAVEGWCRRVVVSDTAGRRDVYAAVASDATGNRARAVVAIGYVGGSKPIEMSAVFYIVDMIFEKHLRQTK